MLRFVIRWGRFSRIFENLHCQQVQPYSWQELKVDLSKVERFRYSFALLRHMIRHTIALNP